MRLRLDARKAEESELRYIDQLRVALQNKFNLHAEDNDNQSLSSDFGVAQDRPMLYHQDTTKNAFPPQGSSNQEISSGNSPTSECAVLSATESLCDGTAQTGGNPV